MKIRPIIQVNEVSKSYGAVKAIEDISLSVNEGETLGIIGANGSGKTTLLEIIQGLRKADHGKIQIDGMNIEKHHHAIQEIIGVQLQGSNLYSQMKVWEAFHIFATYYKRHYNPEDILKLVNLEEKRNTYFDDLSTGQKQRVLIGLALINDPKIILLDEPTNGVDIHTRHKLWKLIHEMKKQKRTILLTTHYLEEIQSVCDKIAILHNQHLAEYGTIPDLLKKHAIHNVISFLLKHPIDNNSKIKMELDDYLQLSQKTENNHLMIDKNGCQFFISTKEPHNLSHWLLGWAKKHQLHFQEFLVKEASLEDLFLKVTKREL